MSIDLLSAIKQVKNPRHPEENIQIRIGIHSGQYDLSHRKKNHIYTPPDMEQNCTVAYGTI